MRRVRAVVCVQLLLGLLYGVAAAQIPATDDSYTASSSPTTNFGKQPSLDVIGPGVNSYIRFDLSALPAGPTSSNVSMATVRLNINGVSAAGTFDLFLVISSWSEGTVTYNNAPTLGAKVASAISISTSKRNFVDVDVTSAVRAWLSGSTNYGIALVPSSGSSISVSIDSKENTSTSHDPELNVELVSAGPRDYRGHRVFKVRKAHKDLRARPALPGLKGQPDLRGLLARRAQLATQGHKVRREPPARRDQLA